MSSVLYSELSASARAKPKGSLPWSLRRRRRRGLIGPVRSGRGRYCTPRSQVMHQARQVSTGSFPLPDGHLKGVQGQVGAHWPVEVCQPTIRREKTSVTKAT